MVHHHLQGWERSYLLKKVRKLMEQNRAVVTEAAGGDGCIPSPSTTREGPSECEERFVLTEPRRTKKAKVKEKESQVVVLEYVLKWMRKEEFTAFRAFMEVMG